MSSGPAAATTVLLVDDHRIFRESLRALLDLHEDVRVVAEAGSGEEAVRLAGAHVPDVVLLDVEMPGQSVLTTLADLRRAVPDARVVVLTMHENTSLARLLLLQGASAYLIKTIGHQELVDAVRASVASAPELLSLAFTQPAPAGEADAAVLTGREVAVLALAGQGRSDAEIGAELRLPEDAVARHLATATAKLGTATRQDAVRRAARLGLIGPPGR